MSFILRSLISLIIKDHDTVRKWEIRGVVALNAVVTTLDTVTDVMVLNEWYWVNSNDFYYGEYYYWEKMKPYHERLFIIGIVTLALSEIVSTMYYVLKAGREGCRGFGVLFHLFGMGSVYHGMEIWRNPVPPPWDLDHDDCDEIGVERWKAFLSSKSIESIFEAMPFAWFQCFLLTFTENYRGIFLVSVVVSFLCTGIPIAEYVMIHCKDHTISKVSFKKVS